MGRRLLVTQPQSDVSIGGGGVSWAVVTPGLVDSSWASGKAACNGIGMALAGTGGGFDVVGDVEVRATSCNGGENCEVGVEVEPRSSKRWAPDETVIEFGTVAVILGVVLVVGRCTAEGST